MSWKESLKKQLKKGAKKLAKEADKELKSIYRENFGDDSPKPRRKKRARKEAVTKKKSSESKPLPPETDTNITRIIQSVEQFQEIREPSRELSYQDMLGQHLKHDFPHVKLRYKIANTEIDAFIDGVGIEVKVYLNKSEADRLFGQLALFHRTIKKIIVVAYRPNLQWLQEFEASVRNHFPRDSVYIMVK